MPLSISLPDWLLPTDAPRFASDAEAMSWALALARRNIAEGGGPFAALVLDADARPACAGAAST